MKKFFKIAMMFVAACTLSTGLVACGDDDDDNTTDPNALNETELSIQQVTKQYLENVVFTTYTNLANATDDLYEQLDDAKAKFRAGTLTQGDIDQICAKFLEARTYWEVLPPPSASTPTSTHGPLTSTRWPFR